MSWNPYGRIEKKADYEDYPFCLWWEDIPEETRKTLIDRYIEKEKANGEYSEEELADEYTIRRDAEESIEAHFPVYF